MTVVADELRAIEGIFDRLRPLPRSITGEGIRCTHEILSELIPLNRIEVPSGAKVFDWEVPPEWSVDQAYIVTPDGHRILDYAVEPLHLVGYSTPFRGRLARAELDTYLHSLPEQPNAIPYVTSYYSPRWGFCITHKDRMKLPEGEYEVVIDSRLVPGSLTISDCVLQGQSDKEVLISTYTCHPSMANNELSGPIVAAFLYARLARLTRRRLSYRFVFLPETIGAIAYLQLRGSILRDRVVAGYVATCTGGPDGLTYKRSFKGVSLAYRAAEHVLNHLSEEPQRSTTVIDFVPTGSDERQYNSPGFRLPVGSLMRTMYGTYPEYHTSLDDKEFVELAAVQRTLDAYFQICCVLDGNAIYRSKAPDGEPNLGMRGLYPTSTFAAQNVGIADATLWTLNMSDGMHDLLTIAERSGLPFESVREAANRLLDVGLLEECPSR